jgi:glutamate racemase
MNRRSPVRDNAPPLRYGTRPERSIVLLEAVYAPSASQLALRPSDDPNAPIGLFDSGVGGLTVLSRIQKRLPNERFRYVADQAHVPYGDRSLEQIKELATALTEHLFESGAKTVVMACNISSATALDAARRRFGASRVMGVIEPGARMALAVSDKRRIGVLATAGTAKTRAYSQTIARLDSRAIVVEVACPRFVPLVEANQHDSEPAYAAARCYLEPLLDARVDTVILGCTHYPYLMNALERAAEGRINFVDPAAATADQLAAMLGSSDLLGTGPRAEDVLTTTGDPSIFTSQAERFLKKGMRRVDSIQWRDGHLVSR